VGCLVRPGNYCSSPRPELDAAALRTIGAQAR